MSRDIEVLEQIKKKEESSEQRISAAQKQAESIIAESMKDAETAMQKSKKEGERLYNLSMERAKEDAEEQKDGIIKDARKKAQRIKNPDKETVLKIFQKAIKDKFGV